MIHKPIQIKNLSLSFPHKTCFDDFNIQIKHGSRIAIIGRNGSGKTTLLKILQGAMEPTGGFIECGRDAVFGFVPQIIESFNPLSGGQRFNEVLTQALNFDPNVLLLDEPTNHLDQHNRKSLMRMLKSFSGTLIVVSHDIELLRYCTDTLWHVDNGQIQVFSGNYDDYICSVQSRRVSIENELICLDKQKKDMQYALMREQKRAAKSKARGEKHIRQKKWPTIVSAAKSGRAEETSGRKKSIIEHKKQRLGEQLSRLRLPEIIVPKFSISPAENAHRMIVSISEGCIGYTSTDVLLQKISLSIYSKDRVAIQGDNASGKSTLIKAILEDASVLRWGNWIVPKRIDIGYFDQCYSTLAPKNTVYETIAALAPTWSHIEVRRFLNDFLFRKNEEVNTAVCRLSGGEKARLALAQIAVLTPKLLILDEITNNLDLETREHVIEVLKVGSSRVDLQACKLEYSIVSPK